MSRVYDDLMDALNEALIYERGEKECKTTTVTVAPLPEFDAQKIKDIRANMKMTQSVFATVLGVSSRTVEAWERGSNKPSGAACRLLSMAEQDKQLPEHYNIITRNVT